MTDEHELARQLHQAYTTAVQRSGQEFPDIPYDKLPLETQSIMLYMAIELIEDDELDEEVILS